MAARVALAAHRRASASGWCADLEEYSEAQWVSLQADRLGFKGNYQNTPPATEADEAAAQQLAAFYEPLNARLEALCREHNISWQPFGK